MSISLGKEEVIGLAEAARRLPQRSNGKKIHVSTLYRWSSRGCKGVKLETIRVGGQKFTSMEALQRFSRELSDLEEGTPNPGGEWGSEPRGSDVRLAEEAVSRELGVGVSQ